MKNVLVFMILLINIYNYKLIFITLLIKISVNFYLLLLDLYTKYYFHGGGDKTNFD